MEFVIVLCLLGFSFGAPQRGRPQKESILPIDELNVETLTDEELIGFAVKEAIKEIREEFPEVDTGKFLEKGLDLEKIFEEFFRGLDVELVKKGTFAEDDLTQEDMETIFGEVLKFAKEDLSQEDVEVIIGEVFKAYEQLPDKNKDEIMGFLSKEFLRGVMEGIKEGIKEADRNVDTEKLREIGIALETHLMEVLPGLDLESLVRRAIAGEDVEVLLEEAISLETFFSESFIQNINNDHSNGKVVEVIHQEFIPVIGPMFAYKLQLDNGIAETRSGSEGPNGTSIMQGSFSIPLDNGEVATFNWVADENGYRVESPYLPIAPQDNRV